LAREQVVDGDGQQHAYTERDEVTATRDLRADYWRAADAPAETREPLPSEAARHQVVVGAIPAEAAGFRPRDSLLADLDRGGVRIPVTGRQGLGATQLAAAYARAKQAAGWRLVAWVNGGDTGSLMAGLAAVADATGLTDEDSGRRVTDAPAAVRHWLETDGDRCLVVFDDVSDPKALEEFLPAHGAARVLITSTRWSATNLGGAVRVDVFSAAEASAFLAARTGQDDEARAAAVAGELGYLPLALALAAPVIRGQQHGYTRYLDRLQTIPVEHSLTQDDGQPYPHHLARAVLLSLAAIRAADQTGMCTRVMQIVAVLSAAGVRRELLHIAGRAGVLASGGRRVEATQVDRVLAWLRDRSLLTFSTDGQTVVTHRLVARVIRDGLARQRRLGAVCWVAASVLEGHAIAVAGSQDRSGVRGIPQQVTALVDNSAKIAEEADDELAAKLLRLRFIALYHLIELGDNVTQAIAIGEPLTADLEQLLGPGHPETVNAQNSLAAAYLAVDRVADAIRLFEQTLAVLQRQLGSDHPDTLTSQNNLASAYQDAGRVAEAIRIYEPNLAVRERLLGVDDPGTLNSRGNLAAAYLGAGRVGEAIPLLEQTLASRERVLGPDHPDTQTSRRNLAKAYQDVGRAAEATPLIERTLAGRYRMLRPDHRHAQISPKNRATAFRDEGRAAQAIPPAVQTPAVRDGQAAADAANVLPGSFRRPPADPARPVLPVGFRRPPADPAGRLRSDRLAAPQAKLPSQAFPSRSQGVPVKEGGPDRDVIAAIAAGDRAGIANAYDRHAPALYGYCHWMLHDEADAAESVQDAFVLAAATLSELSGQVKLRPWLFALARQQCRGRIRPGSANRDEADAANQRADGNQRADEAQRVDVETRPADAAAGLLDAADRTADATVQFPVVGRPTDATVQFPVVGGLAEVIGGPADATMEFRIVSGELPPVPVDSPADSTMQFRVVSELTDVTMPFLMTRKPAPAATQGLADVNGYLGQTELRALIRSILADMKPREREVIELSFRHDLDDDDLAIALGVSSSRARALASRTRVRLEKSFGTLRTALAGRQTCPVVGELLADWDGRLNEQTRDLVAWHIEQCQICVNQARGALHPTVLSGLLPLAPLAPELRQKVLSHCYSTSEDAVAYRRRVVRRAESTWAALFSQAIRRVSWGSIRANPGAAIATTAVAMWAVAAVSVTLLAFTGSHLAQARAAPPASRATHALAVQPNAVTSSASPAAARTSAGATPSPRVTQPSAYVSSQVQPTPSLEASKSPSPSRSSSPKPSKSPTPSKSPSPSPSPSATSSASASSSPSPAA
jgi:RNA polymerase sigma factor (sigma-70 family)